MLLALVACRLDVTFDVPFDPSEVDDLVHVPAGEAPAGANSSTRGEWDEWKDAKLVFALHEPIFYTGSEDEIHARLMAFEDGRVLYRVRDDDRSWEWFVANIGATEVEELRRSLARDLASSPRGFSCRDATHQRLTAIIVRTGARWRVREGYALSACLPEVEPDFVPSSSHAVPLAPPDAVPPGFLRAYRKLRDFHVEHRGSPWHTPKLWLVWYLDVGDYSEERVGRAWPSELPSPPKFTPAQVNAGKLIYQPVDAAFDRMVSRLLPNGGLIDVEGRRWAVEVHRLQPGDAAVMCAWSYGFLRCTPRTLKRRHDRALRAR